MWQGCGKAEAWQGCAWQASAVSVARSSDPKALRICTVEVRNVAQYPTTHRNTQRSTRANTVSRLPCHTTGTLYCAQAFALLLSELGETEAHTRPFVDAVLVNNQALGPTVSLEERESTARAAWEGAALGCDL